ncbi:TraR/DksA C4-type zinc finger protein [uncultured Tateyamaria sp.]|uniref:TraR/DksA family transcriptional regulator n=1 Tax=uncultured Tateyamaria sp. TaxID=455651 RepID=UPI0026235455|nr:TraR/DksA C4-type zinc finger protein [uncultured Tateyamaria sp.]
MRIADRQQALEARRAELVGDLTEIEHQLDAPAPKDLEDRSSERQGDEVLEALGHAELNEVSRIDAALARIAAGTYGDCVKCGVEISQARLDLLPATPFCKSCAI